MNLRSDRLSKMPYEEWRNVGTVTPAIPGGAVTGDAKLHDYLFSQMRLKCGGRKKKQSKDKIYSGYNKARVNDGRWTEKLLGV